jgi:hypothetical protein
MATINKAIADASFTRVVIYVAYRDKWITDRDFVRIIACEHGLVIDDTIKFDAVTLNRALKADIRYGSAEDQDGCEAGSTIFRKHYTTKVAGSNQRRTVFCYCIGHQPRLGQGEKWSDTISTVSLNLRKKCGIVVEQAEMFRKAIPAQPQLQNENTPS